MAETSALLDRRRVRTGDVGRAQLVDWDVPDRIEHPRPEARQPLDLLPEDALGGLAERLSGASECPSSSVEAYPDSGVGGCTFTPRIVTVESSKR